MKRKIKPVKQAEEVAVVTQSSASLIGKTLIGPKYARQKAFLQAYLDQDFNVSKACKVVNIGRRTFYNWKERDERFMQELQDAEDEKIESVESALYRKAVAGDVISMIFYLKCRARWNDQPHKQRISYDATIN